MLSPRPEQLFFDEVSLWPPLHQRSLRQLVRIVERAGFVAREQLRLRVPDEGVYAVAALTGG